MLHITRALISASSGEGPFSATSSRTPKQKAQGICTAYSSYRVSCGCVQHTTADVERLT